MNNKSYSYAKKYHYMLKYFVMALPLLLLLLTFLNELSTDALSYKLLTYYYYGVARISPFYTNILNSLNLLVGIQDNVNNLLYRILLYYPAYILWVYVLDLILDVISIIFKLVHKGLNKVVKDYD